jgi:hypothetical protein
MLGDFFSFRAISMSDIFTNLSASARLEKAACRVSYTLNNSQPVACTIIGTQPLFYMDYEVDYEDGDELLDSGDLGLLEKELSTLKNSIDSFDKFAESFVRGPEEKFQNFLDAKADLVKSSSSKQEICIGDLKVMLGKSRLGQAFLEFAVTHNTKIVHSHQVADAHYDKRSCTLLINPTLSISDQLLLFARELRRHWQHRHGALIHPLMFHPDNAVLVHRAQVADLTVCMVRVAWELQLSGYKDAWEHIENSSMADLGRALAREAFLDFRTLNNGEASAAVFEAWFLSERCRHEDKKLIQQMLADYQGYVFDLEQAEQTITPALISALGTMPYGKNYLSSHAQTIMGDPVFTEVRDRSNANFLWFIKFERSFRETEQELQTGKEHLSGTDNRQAKFQNQKQGSHNVNPAEARPSAEIVRLFPDDGNAVTGDKSRKTNNLLAPKPPRGRKKNKNSAEIIYLRRWSGDKN